MTFDELKEFAAIHHHKFLVLQFMNAIIHNLIARAEGHDSTKFTDEEFAGYVSAIEEIQKHPFGTPEYEAMRVKHAKVFQLHYSKSQNHHHPEHFANGVEDMNLMDLIEMLVDWKAASTRSRDGGSIATSIKVGAEKYNIPPQLVKILENTAKSCKM